MNEMLECVTGQKSTQIVSHSLSRGYNIRLDPDLLFHFDHDPAAITLHFRKLFYTAISDKYRLSLTLVTLWSPSTN